MLNQSTESELNSLLDGEQHNAAIGLALRCYGPEVFSYLIVLLRDKGLAEEAYSMFTEALVRGIRSFKQQCPFRAWAYIVAKNEALRVMRQRRGLLPLGSTLQEQLPAPVRSSSPASLQERRLECIRSTLVEEERELLVLRVDRNLAWEDIASIMSTRAVPVSANGLVQRFSRLKRKLKRLREELPETCGRVDCANSEACARRRSQHLDMRST